MPPLTQHFTDIVEELVQLRDGLRPVAHDDPSLEQWEDEQFIYLETALPGEPGLDIDISIHAGRAFVCMVRSTAGPRVPGDSTGREAEVIMIGWVEFDDGGVTRQAILEDDGQWTCHGAPQVAAMLNRDCSPAGDPADDGWGYVALIKAAQRLHGIAWLGPGRPLP